MAGGAVTQLSARGEQDEYITGPDAAGKPPITFFKDRYYKHSEFAMESTEQTFTGTPNFGSRVECEISRSGDLVHSMDLEVDLPEVDPSTATWLNTTTGQMVTGGTSFKWCDHIGHHMIDYVRFVLGGLEIDTQTGLYMHLISQLTEGNGRTLGLNRMIGHQEEHTDDIAGHTLQSYNTEVKKATTLRIPLLFWFCTDIGRSLPLVALQYQSMKVQVQFKPVSDLFSSSANSPTYNNLKLGAVKMWVDYIFLGDDERSEFVEAHHEYIMDSVQCSGSESVIGTNLRVRLPFTSPVKEIIWVVQHDQLITPTTGTADARRWSNQRSNFTDRAYVNPAGLHQMFPAGATNPVKKAFITFTTNPRMAERGGDYFSQRQPMKHHENIPASPAINVYSFAIRPEDPQPTGSANFSMIDNPTLVMTVGYFATGSLSHVHPTAGLIAAEEGHGSLTGTSAKVYMFARTVGVFRVGGGMGGRVYAA
jgi:hypothetical protein